MKGDTKVQKPKQTRGNRVLELRNETELNIRVIIDSSPPLVLLQVLTRVGKILSFCWISNMMPPPTPPPVDHPPLQP